MSLFSMITYVIFAALLYGGYKVVKAVFFKKPAN